MTLKIDLVSDISPSKESWNIKVRVVCLWFVRDMKKDQLPYSLEMVLMDNKVFFNPVFMIVFIFSMIFCLCRLYL